MGIFDGLKSEAQRNFIARADAAKDHIIYKYPERNVRMMTQLTVGADEVALFVKDGVVVGTLGKGRHSLDTNNVPFTDHDDPSVALGWQVDLLTGQTAVLSFLVADTAPASGFYLRQLDPHSGTTLYYSTSMTVTGGPPAPVPEPAGGILLLSLLGMAGVALKSASSNRRIASLL